MGYRPVILFALFISLIACNGGSGSAPSSESRPGNQNVDNNQNRPLVLSVEDEGVVNRETSLKWLPPVTEFPYTRTRDFYIFEEAKMALEASLAAGATSQAFSINVFVHRFTSGEEGSVLAWVNNQYSDHLMVNPATLVNSEALPEESGEVRTASFLRLDQWDNPTFTVEYFVDGYMSDDIMVASFVATANVPEPRGLEQ